MQRGMVPRGIQQAHSCEGFLGIPCPHLIKTNIFMEILSFFWFLSWQDPGLRLSMLKLQHLGLVLASFMSA